MRFNFKGTVGAVTDPTAEKGYFLREGTTGNGAPYASVNFRVSSDKNNTGFVELFGMAYDTIQTTDTNNQKMSVNWDDRNDPDIVKEVANYRKTQINLSDDEQHAYIASLDAVQFIRDHMTEMVGKDFVVTGNVSKDFYNGKDYDKFQITNIYPMKEKDKPKLTMNGDFFFTKDSIDNSDWKDEHKLVINGWTQEYIKEKKKRMYYARTIIFDCSKIDFTKPAMKSAVEYRLKQMKLALDGDKIKNSLKSGKVYKIAVMLTYVNGNEEVQFDESELTDNQREAIALGLKTLEDFRPKDAKIYGNKVSYLKLTDFDLRGDNADGAEELSDKEDEFMEEVYTIQRADEDNTADGFMSVPEGEDQEIIDLFG